MSDIEQAIKLYQKKKYNEAKIILEDILKFTPYDVDALKYMGFCLVALEEAKLALDYLIKANTIEPDPETEGELGICYYLLKDYENAQASLIGSVVAKYNEKYAKTLEQALLIKHNDEAMLGLKLLMFENRPKDIYVLRDITNLAQKLKKFDLALEFFDILINRCPNDYVAWNNLGLVYEEMNEWKKAYDCYKKSLSIKDFFSPNFNLGIMSRKLRNFNDSISYLKKAIAQNPNSPQPKYSLSMSYMMLKDFENGYPLYANHMSVIMPDSYTNEWDGAAHPDSSLCIFSTGGLGDMIMYSRYFEYVKDLFKKVYVLLPKNLHEIFANNFPYVEVVDSKNIFINYDYSTTPMHILKFFNLDFTKFVPHTDGFLKADESLIRFYKEKFFNHDKLKIAINWHGNREGTRTFFNRSIPIEKLEPVFEEYKDRAVFYSIQKDDSYIDAKKYENVVCLYDDINDFNDTAAILKNVDLLISIDSSPVHMAGALGVKTFVLLPYANEWRWFIDDNDSIWYDSVELFRQDTEGVWEPAVSKLLDKMKTIF